MARLLDSFSAQSARCASPQSFLITSAALLFFPVVYGSYIVDYSGSSVTLITHNTVAELDEGTLRYVASIAWNRYHTLQHVMELIDHPQDEAQWQAWNLFCFPQRSETGPEQSAP